MNKDTKVEITFDHDDKARGDSARLCIYDDDGELRHSRVIATRVKLEIF